MAYEQHPTRRGDLFRAGIAAMAMGFGLLGFTAVGESTAATASPVVSVAAQSAVEGQLLSGEVATFRDAALKGPACAPVSDYSITVAWGDGGVERPAATFASGPDPGGVCTYRVIASHTFASAGAFTVTVTALGPNSPAAGSGSGVATVADAPLGVSCTQINATAGSSFGGQLATLTDSNRDGVASQFTATIDWGDGSSSGGTVTGLSRVPTFAIGGSHAWSTAGSFTVKISIADVGGAVTSTTCAVAVTAGTTTASTSTQTTTSTTASSGSLSLPPPFTASILPPTAPVIDGALTRILATAVPPPGQHVVSYQWSLRRPSEFDVDTGSTPFLTHRFTSGSHQIWMRAESSDGSFTTLSSAVIDAGASPSCPRDETFGWLEVTTDGCIQLVRPSTHRSSAREAISTAPHGPIPIVTPQPFYQVPISSGGISLNGMQVTCPTTNCVLTIQPAGNAPLVPGPRVAAYLLTTNKPVHMRLLNTPDGPVELGTDQLYFQWFPQSPGAPNVPFDSSPIAAGQHFAGTPLSGDVDVALTPPDDTGAPGVAITIVLDTNLFGHPADNPVTLNGRSNSDIQTGSGDWSLNLTGLTIPPLVYFDDLRLTYMDHLETDPGYTGPPLDHVFEAQGTATILLTGWQVSVDVIVANGFPIRVAFSYMAGNGSSLISSVVSNFVGLDTLAGVFQSEPFFQIGGELDLSLGGYKVGGGVNYAAAHGSTPFELFLDGQVPIVIPDVDVTVGVYITGDPMPGFGASGTLSADFAPVFSVMGGIYLYVAPGDVEGNVEFGAHLALQVIGINVASATGFINEQWVAGCANLFGLSVYVIAGLQHGEPGPHGGFGGCNNIAPYSIAPELAGLSSTRGHAADATRQVRVRAGMSWANLAVTSAAAVPRVHIAGPGVDYTSPAADGATHSGSVSALVGSTAHEVIIGIHAPRAGVYTVTPMTGSPAITTVEDSLSVASRVTAHVAGRGPRRVLRYSISGPEGQRVQFAERSAHGSALIGVAGNGSGTLRFTPARFAGLKRILVALPTVSGMPRGAINLGRYAAPPPPRLAAPRLRLVYRRVSHSALARWATVRDAVDYLVTLGASDGRKMQLVVKRPQLVIGMLPPGDRVSVSVRAQAPSLVPGPVRRATLTVPRIRRVKLPRR